MTKQKKLILKKRILPTALASISLPFILCFAVPFEIFCTNKEEFLFSAWDFIPALLAAVLFFSALFFVCIFFLPERLHKIFVNVFVMLAFLCFLQGTYLNRGLTFSTNGTGYKASKKVLNLLLWIALLGFAVGISFLKDKKEIVKTISLIISVVIIATQTVGFTKNSIVNGEVFSPKLRYDAEGDTEYKVLTDKDLTELSTGHNVLYFCFDKFDEYFAEHTYKHYTDIFSELDGFTWFRDNTSLYGHTYPSVAYMLTGNLYDPEKRRNDFLNHVFDSDETLSVLSENGYKTDIYTERFYVYNMESKLPEYIANQSEVKSIKIRDRFMLCAGLVDMALYRCFPVYLKECLSTVNADLCNGYVQYVCENGYVENVTGNVATYKNIKSKEFTTTEQDIFKFIHIRGLHANFAAFESDNMDKKTAKTRNIAKDMKNSLAVVMPYIEYLKQHNLYKDATIIITGDHPTPYYNYSELGGVKLTALLVKPAGVENAELKISDAPVSHVDLWPTIFKESGIVVPQSYEYTDSVFDIDSLSEDMQAARVRPFIWHTYERDDNMEVYDYIVKGSGRDFANWSIESHAHYDRGIMY